MPRCFYCGEEIGALPFKCKYCQNQYCGTHRLPENHICVGPIKSPRKVKPVKQYSFQNVSEKFNNSRYYSDSEPKINPKYNLACILVIVLAVVLGITYGLDIVQLDYWVTQVFGNLFSAILAFGFAIMLPLMFTKHKSRYNLNLTPQVKNAIVKIVLLGELLIFISGFMIAGNYTIRGMGEFGTIFWTFVGLTNLFLLGIYLEVNTRTNKSNHSGLTLRKVTILSSIIIIINVFFLVLLGFLTSWSITPYTTFDNFLEYYWISYSLFIGFHLGRIVTRW